MSNYIVDNQGPLKRRHYLLKANQKDHWFNASPNVVRNYQARHGDDFCLILYRTGLNNDAYVVPFQKVKSLFTKKNLVTGPNGILRWHGDIKEGRLGLRSSHETVSVNEFYNGFRLLEGQSYRPTTQ
jgi:hypothetical protein